MKPIHVLLFGLSLTLANSALANSGIDKSLIAKANQGDKVAQADLGLAYFKSQDYTRAKQYFELAAAQGNAKAQYNLGVFYDEGYGVRQNHRTAKKWFSKACNNGEKKGCDDYRKLQQRGY